MNETTHCRLYEAASNELIFEHHVVLYNTTQISDEEEIEQKAQERRRRGQDPDWDVVLNATISSPLVVGASPINGAVSVRCKDCCLGSSWMMSSLSTPVEKFHPVLKPRSDAHAATFVPTF